MSLIKKVSDSEIPRLFQVQTQSALASELNELNVNNRPVSENNQVDCDPSVHILRSHSHFKNNIFDGNAVLVYQKII